jgi:predicted lipid-binding transport protein (Tim44 family)
VTRPVARAGHPAARLARQLAPGGLLALALVLHAASAAARPGGGQSFGGRGGGGGSGGDGACSCAFDLVIFLLDLTISHPAIGIPLDVVVLVIVIVAFSQSGRKGTAWSTSGNGTGTTAAAEGAALRLRPSRAVRRDLLATVTRHDPDFSLVLFEDFLYALYAAAQEARGKNQLAPLAAYLRPPARQVLAAHGGPASGLTEVRTVVIGALRYLDVQGFGPTTPIQVTVEIEANYTEIARGAEHPFYVVERWTLERAPGARSRPPEKASIIGCPNCGAPLSELRGNQCRYCQQTVDTGQFDWMVTGIEEKDRLERPPQLTSDSDEGGTDLPTVIDPEAGARMQALTRRDPSFQWTPFLSRVSTIFAELQPAWSTLEWTRARPFVSDPLFQMLAYWIESYRASHLRNVTENARVIGIEFSSMVSDRYYDAITVRVRALGLDYTIRDDGQLVSGSRTRERIYTEYWTLIRGASARTRTVGDKACPNCGAPLSINMAGSCTHCQAKVTSGNFDWVLSRIEQDEAYTG